MYVDEELLALDKPVGLPVLAGQDTPAPFPQTQPSPVRATSGPALLPLLHGAIRETKPWAKALGLSFLMPAYRLDPEVGGVLLFARSKEILRVLHDLFGSEKPTLRFSALVQGSLDWSEFEQDVPLLPVPDAAGKYRVGRRGGKRSRTHFRVLERFASHALLECEPFTHRPHQVRAHSARLGFPLAGDLLYGGEPLLLSRIKPGYHLKPGHSERPLLDRPAIHVRVLEINHPADGQQLRITAPLPRDFEAALKYLRRFSR